jgi:hypothetical protein
VRKRLFAFAGAAAISVCIALVATPGAASASVARTSPPSAQLIVASPNASPVQGIHFCNSTGGTIACFDATVTFNNRNTFTLSQIDLKDMLCDHRSVYALLYWQSGFEDGGTDPIGDPITWGNSKGCGSKITPANLTVSVSGGVQYVAVYLWAANLNGRSSVVSSNQKPNPFF